MKPPEKPPEDEVAINRDGWFCLRHKDGWLVGSEKGVTCYRQRQIARAALTFAVEREQGRMVYSIEVFRAKNVRPDGEHTPVLSADEAWKNLEGKR